MRALLINLQLDRTSGVPLAKQIYEHVRELILAGLLAKDQRLETSRRISAHLGCGRNVVLEAIEHLIAEGYLRSIPRSGVIVSLDVNQVGTIERRDDTKFDALASLSALGRAMVDRPRFDTSSHSRLSPGLPETESFSFDVWTRLFRRIWCNPRSGLIREKDPMGYYPLREAIARHLQATRGLRCRAEHVLVTNGVSSSIDLLGRLLLEPGDDVWVEEPSFLQATSAILAGGMRVLPVPVGPEGFDVEAALSAWGTARMALVSPSHQFPLGMTMSAANRLKLINWAIANNAWILEDDYNSEFRYEGSPIAPLQSLDTAGRVVYLGTFSKTLLPNLRLGYIVANPDLVTRLAQARYQLDGHSSYQLQPVVAAYIQEGHFARHIFKMQKLYASRRSILAEALRAHLGDYLTELPSTAGMHLVACLRERAATFIDDTALSEISLSRGEYLRPLSPYYFSTPKRQGLVIGFGSLDVNRVDRLFEDIGCDLRSLEQSTVHIQNG
jgi:GntR family transcriptional regulator / MocR family aminotransferase